MLQEEGTALGGLVMGGSVHGGESEGQPGSEEAVETGQLPW